MSRRSRARRMANRQRDIFTSADRFSRINQPVLFPYTKTRIINFNNPLQTRRKLLDHTVFKFPAVVRSVSRPRTVRTHLIRTVPRDTRKPQSPALLVRAQGRQAWPAWSSVMDPIGMVARQEPLKRAITCAKRSIRREVLFALGLKNGAGSGGKPKSKVRC